ncbi:MAG: ATP phosphoribosyltransferase [Chloroflexota bacterium]|nr:ATP phosphoribosyltransferase [Chloroflexota bacterium]MDE2929700.1 ATP phosphoribosyltransferase [Chloroflexota bacterium]
MAETLRLLVPSKGRIGEQTLEFFAKCGLDVVRPNSRAYEATLPTVANVAVLFQRAWQMVEQVRSGDADAGITGFDILSEMRQEGDDLVVVAADLGYSHGQLAIAVPEEWIDVRTLTDLAEVALEFRERGRVLRIATTFPTLTRQFLFQQGITYFQVVQAEGGLEAAPMLGYADIIVDLVSTGATLKDNRLKMIEHGVILRTQACLIGNRERLRASATKREALRQILEFVEASQRAAPYSTLTANMQGDSAEAIATTLAAFPEVGGLLGPTIARVFARDEQDDSWFAVTVQVKSRDLLAAVASLRQAGCVSVSVTSPHYIFARECTLYQDLLKTLKLAE